MARGRTLQPLRPRRRATSRARRGISGRYGGLEALGKGRPADAPVQATGCEELLHEIDHGHCLRSGKVFAFAALPVSNALDDVCRELIGVHRRHSCVRRQPRRERSSMM